MKPIFILMSALILSVPAYSQSTSCQQVSALEHNSATYVVTLVSGETLTTIGTNEEFRECYELAKLALVHGLKFCITAPGYCRVEK